jgi:3-hydroxyacyl-CoA dehydrogenase
MNRKINKIAILGSGVMGSRIACHFANIGAENKNLRERFSLHRIYQILMRLLT